MPIESALAFDHEFTLAELLRGINTEKLLQALSDNLQTPVQILDAKSQPLFGANSLPENNQQSINKAVLIGELEPIGYIQAEASVVALKSATQLVQLILQSNARYLMASDIHIQTQRDDFEELQRRHDALELSKTKYKNLAESLDLRVKQQVKTIQSAQIKLYENEKLASVGRLAAGVAHEINNPIGFIHSNLFSAQNYLKSLAKLDEAFKAQASTSYLQQVWQEEDLAFMQEDLQDILQESIDGIDRVASIVKDLKSFSRINDAAEEDVDLNEIIRQMCHVSSPQLKDKLEVILDLGDIPKIFCHPAELGQVFLSLFLNAADAIQTQGKVRFKTYLCEAQVCIEIRDTGCGISTQNLAHIFDPFFTTKEVGHGVGLGLTVCLNVIKAHGGSLELKSKQGAGTLVTILLPIRHKDL
ncbi:MAG: ATP-binding protein [Methyloprofundus sp.]|nr:ATP-binding protein [Methyloprofundus sp.]MDT8426382.1 ATP-binding protein [Methyloprofundus sp.]